MGQEADVLGVVVCLVLALALLLGLSWVNAFEDAQAPGKSHSLFAEIVSISSKKSFRQAYW